GKITNIYHKDSSKFDEGSSIEEIPLPTPLQYERRKEKLSWFQNHKRWLKKRPISNRGNEPIENILFTPRGTDSTLIQTVIGYRFTLWTCENDDPNIYDKSKLLTKVVLHLDEERMFLDEKTFPLYFELEKTDVYKCTKGADSFLRVITEFRGKTGIKQVNYHDGVKVFRKSIQLGVDTALIVEQKYLDSTDFKVIKYDRDGAGDEEEGKDVEEMKKKRMRRRRRKKGGKDKEEEKKKKKRKKKRENEEKDEGEAGHMKKKQRD
ncbi:hypothetical protein LSTR_LSTR014223, partial [Laodelphax striatellus]